MLHRAFTLIELLVTISIIAVLIGILTPALRGARDAAISQKCLSNIRNMEIASIAYAATHNGELVDVGLGHGGSVVNEAGSFITTLSDFMGAAILEQSPGDDSPFWPREKGGEGLLVNGSPNGYRTTSYGINAFFTSLGPTLEDPARGLRWRVFRKIQDVPQPSRWAHFVMMAEQGAYAASDHVHPELFGSFHERPGRENEPPKRAAVQMQTDAHGGPPGSWSAVANYGFLDGHAESLRFSDVYSSGRDNRFNPNLSEPGGVANNP